MTLIFIVCIGKLITIAIDVAFRAIRIEKNVLLNVSTHATHRQNGKINKKIHKPVVQDQE